MMMLSVYNTCMLLNYLKRCACMLLIQINSHVWTYEACR